MNGARVVRDEMDFSSLLYFTLFEPERPKKRYYVNKKYIIALIFSLFSSNFLSRSLDRLAGNNGYRVKKSISPANHSICSSIDRPKPNVNNILLSHLTVPAELMLHSSSELNE